ncbi:ABC transporter permease [Candidatus Hadarchaeum sp.]|uniref:ABC transporter permease n=1 Tax=Candidatus Hadarchaeum sp. TaxID=2883567 RepID=UPI00319E3597
MQFNMYTKIEYLVLNSLSKKLKYFLSFFLFLMLLMIGEIVSPGYFSLSHIIHLLTLAAPLGILTIGQTFVILSGKEDVDFSTGACASLSIVLTALVLQKYSLAIAIGIAALSGLIAGVINGIGVRIMKIPPLLMTFGSAMLLYGVGQAITRGMSLGTASPFLTFIAVGRIGGIPIAFLIWIGLIVISAAILHETAYGRWLYASGSNPKAAGIAGISNAFVGIAAYAVSGLLSAFAGLLYLGRFTIPSGFRMAEVYTLPSIMAVILGGTSFSGGEGGFLGSIGGVLALTTLDSFFSIFNISQAWRNVLNGFLLVLILIFYARKSKIRI